MARLVLNDFLQAFPFWLMDVPFGGGPADLPVLNPLLGFASCTSPEITAEVHEISEANWIFKKKVLKNADVGNITLTRGATFYDTDFYKWILSALGMRSGNASSFGVGLGSSPRRNLLLIHYFSSNPIVSSTANAALASVQEVARGLPGPFETAARVPARAFYLQGCLPMRYKSGSDFDARTSDVSVMELELAVELMEQVVLTQ